MTIEQELFKRFFEWAFEDHAQDVVRTVVWMNSHMVMIKRDYPKEYLAYKALTNQQINQVICEVLLPFITARGIRGNEGVRRMGA